mgnify:CR=1 FL=1
MVNDIVAIDFATLIDPSNSPSRGGIGDESKMDKFIAHCYKDEKRELKDALRKGRDVLILIGPEGDFSQEEAELAVEHGFIPVHLGASRLRTETAALTAVSAAYFRYM